ncbi:MAG TPA: signal recognition particle receptor subunit alpha [Candidatus Thalassarchaeaceae archaeon]|jgi:signal recognition particle subunit SRP54|nr:signal recognition particle receptor subunit alpha [Candidatus Thalassarchaeaceae archaeon]
MALEGLKRGIQGALSRLRGKRSIDEEELRAMVKDLRRALLAADFNVRQTKEITDRLELRMRDDEPRPGLTLQTHAMNIIYAELVRLLGAPREILPFNQRILMVGLYGQGKTTTTAKIAAWWKRKHKLEIGVIEADVHRPGAYAQLKQLLESHDIDVYGDPENTDATAIVRDGMQKMSTKDVVIVDTAGRDQLDEELQDELLKIADIVQATESLLVIDAQVGQAAGPVAAKFHELVGVSGVIVTKLDGTARGGGALSAVAATGSPIVFIGEGERVENLEQFEGDRFISRLLGMGDIQGLIDLAPGDLDQEEAMRLTERLMSGRFSINDMSQQMEMMSKIGTVDRILSHLPSGMFGGIGAMGKAQKEQMQSNLERFRVIMDSMTSKEKDEPTILKAERIRRISRGAGVNEKDVRELIAQWNRSRKMMKGIRGNRQLRKQMKSMMGDMDDMDMPM